MRAIASGVFGLVLAVVLTSILLPNTEIAWMRDHWSWFNQPMLVIERIGGAVNLVHAVLFVLLGMATRAAMPRLKLKQVAWALLLFGISNELVQFFIPGRHLRLSDVAMDLVAGVLGWAAMWGLAWHSQRLSGTARK